MSKIPKLLFLSLFIGLVSGILSTLFLALLNDVTTLRNSYPQLIWGLPFFGLLLSIVIKRIPQQINQGVPYILGELERPKTDISPWMTPFIFLSSLGTHLFGGSAGREGVGVIMGASAAHLLSRLGHSFKDLKKFFIYGGMAAGFSSIFGTPVTAIVFSFELRKFENIKKKDLLLTTIMASFTAFLVSSVLGASHQHFVVHLNLSEVLPYIFISGIISGIAAHIFYWGNKGYTQLISAIFPNLSVKLVAGGLAISVFVFLTKSYDYIGLGTEILAKSFVQEMSSYDFMMKALLTIMTISIGFKGGEVTPLFFMGATFSNWSCALFNLRNFSLSSSFGMVALFGAVTGAPLASAVMGMELFGWKVGLFCLISCYMAKFIMGKRSVYRH